MTQWILVVYAGFTHAFETDHLLAVSSIVTRRERLRQAARDGIYWGLGHSSTILLIGLLLILLKMHISENAFRYLEACVGVMLIVLAVFRIRRLFRSGEAQGKHVHVHEDEAGQAGGHRLAYSVGLVHGLAGSGALVALVLTQMRTPLEGILYLLVFGVGSVAGMWLAASIFSVPFSMRVMRTRWLQPVLVAFSSVLCIVFGTLILYENLAA